MIFDCKNRSHSSYLAFSPIITQRLAISERQNFFIFYWQDFLPSVDASDLPREVVLKISCLQTCVFACNSLYPQSVCPQCQTTCYWYFLSVNVLFIFLWVHQCLSLLFLLFSRIIELSEAICAQLLQHVQVKYSIQIYYRKNSSWT